jgi:hypothetical protein
LGPQRVRRAGTSNDYPPAEKPDDGNELSLAGRERAAALVPYFLGNSELINFGPPVAIYAQSQKKQTSSVRAIETVHPMADAIHVKIDESFSRDEFKSMVDEIKHKQKYDGRMVLICWEHKVIPEIASAFGADDAPEKWHGDVFDRVWIITFRPNEKPLFKNLPQRLLFGDSEK